MTSQTMPLKERSTRLSGFIAGLGTLVAIWPAGTAPLRYPHRSESDALRGDGQKIGDDMRRVIERERANAKATS